MFEKVLIVAGVPRSGTSWLGEIINSSPDVAYRFQPLFSYAFKDRVGIDSSPSEYVAFLRELYFSQDSFLLQSEKRISGIYPAFAKDPDPGALALKKTRYHYLHIRFLSYFDNLKLVAIVRNPCAVLASWIQNPKEFPLGSDPRKEWRFGNCKNNGQAENFFGFYKWREATNIFLDLETQFAGRVRVIRYEDLVDDVIGISRSLYDFAGLDFTRQTADFLTDCNSYHSNNPYSVYKNKQVKDLWRQELDPGILHDVEQELMGTRLEVFIK